MKTDIELCHFLVDATQKEYFSFVENTALNTVLDKPTALWARSLCFSPADTILEKIALGFK